MQHAIDFLLGHKMKQPQSSKQDPKKEKAMSPQDTTPAITPASAPPNPIGNNPDPSPDVLAARQAAGLAPTAAVLPPSFPPLDFAGVAITMGATVKIVGVVVAIDVKDAHFQEISILPSHPNTTAVQNIVGVNPQQQPFLYIKAAPTQILVGS